MHPSASSTRVGVFWVPVLYVCNVRLYRHALATASHSASRPPRPRLVLSHRPAYCPARLRCPILCHFLPFCSFDVRVAQQVCLGASGPRCPILCHPLPLFPSHVGVSQQVCLRASGHPGAAVFRLLPPFCLSWLLLHQLDCHPDTPPAWGLPPVRQGVPLHTLASVRFLPSPVRPPFVPPWTWPSRLACRRGDRGNAPQWGRPLAALLPAVAATLRRWTSAARYP